MFKVQYKQINKRINFSSINKYAQFIEKVKGSFKHLPKMFTCQYEKDRRFVDVHDDASFLLMKQNETKFQIVEVDHQTPPPEVSKRVVQEKRKGQSVLALREDNGLKEFQSSLDLQGFGTIVPSINEAIQFTEQLIFENMGLKIKLMRRKIHQEREMARQAKKIYYQVQCSECQSSITAKRWRSLERFDVDYCEKCYGKRKNKDQQFLYVQDEEMLSKVDLREGIYYMFDPSYVEQKQQDTFKPWIRSEDIALDNMEAVSEIWRASEALIQQIADDL